MDSLRIASMPLAASSWVDPSPFMAFHATSITSIDSIFSKMPSQHRRIKSSLEDSLNFLIQGSAEITSLIPPSTDSFASISPIVRDTDNLPGQILRGPIIVQGLSSFFVVILVISVRQILPPFQKIRFCSFASMGRWSLLRLKAYFPQSVLRMALESPTLATQQQSSTMRTTRAHDPLFYSFSPFAQLAFTISQNLFSHDTIDSKRDLRGSWGKSLWLMRISWRLSFRQSQQLLPPWPSQTAKNCDLTPFFLMFRVMLTRSSLQFLLTPAWVLIAQALTTPFYLLDTFDGSNSGILVLSFSLAAEIIAFRATRRSYSTALESSQPCKAFDSTRYLPSLLQPVQRIDY